jgi:amidase
MMDDLCRRSATELAQLIRDKKVSPTEVLEAHLAAIEEVNPTLNAFVTVDAEKARGWAKEQEAAIMAGSATGCLTGVPIGIKDLTPTEGIRTTWGTTLFADHIPTEDAEVVKRIKAAGAVILGKTNTPEYGTGGNTYNAVFGATRNPWNAALSASGSTGGGASALASRMVPLAEGTDFGGSLRTPAAFCGVTGLRTTSGLIPKHPATLPWHDQSVEGPMARSAEDCALLLDAMTGLSLTVPMSVAPTWDSAHRLVTEQRDLTGVRIAYVADIAGIGIDHGIAGVCRAAALGLKDAGATVEETEFDISFGKEAFLTLRGESMVGNHLNRLDKLDQLGANLRGNIEAGLKLTIIDIARAEHIRTEVWHRWRAIFEQYDFLLTPTVPVEPFPVEQNYPEVINGKPLETYIEWVAQTFLPSLAALPAASVPAGLSASGLPIGLQIVGPRFREPGILGVAKFVEQANPLGLPPNCA